jgi:hypothetical protein
VNWLIKGDRLEHKVHSIDGNETKEGVMLQIDQLIAKEHSFYEQSKAKKAPHDCTYTLQMTKRLKDFINESRKSAGLEVAN